MESSNRIHGSPDHYVQGSSPLSSHEVPSPQTEEPFNLEVHDKTYLVSKGIFHQKKILSDEDWAQADQLLCFAPKDDHKKILKYLFKYSHTKRQSLLECATLIFQGQDCEILPVLKFLALLPKDRRKSLCATAGPFMDRINRQNQRFELLKWFSAVPEEEWPTLNLSNPLFQLVHSGLQEVFERITFLRILRTIPIEDRANFSQMSVTILHALGDGDIAHHVRFLIFLKGLNSKKRALIHRAVPFLKCFNYEERDQLLTPLLELPKKPRASLSKTLLDRKITVNSDEMSQIKGVVPLYAIFPHKNRVSV